MLVRSRCQARTAPWLLVVLSLAVACESDSDTLPRDVGRARSDAGHDAGLDDGSLHADSGSPADASLDGSMSAPHDMPLFSMRLDGRMLVLDTLGHELWSFKDCANTFVLEKLVNNGWVPIRDERPRDGHGYYLDGDFIRGQSTTCDDPSCLRLGKTRNIARAEEYVQIGTQRPPPDEPDPMIPVFMVSSRPLAGPLRLTVHYYPDKSSCAGEEQIARVEMAIPSEGVCCPIGPAQCSSSGPGGGWAKSYDTCPGFDFDTAFNMAFAIEADSHGCPVLRQDPTLCCNDCVEADAGSAVPGTD